MKIFLKINYFGYEFNEWIKKKCGTVIGRLLLLFLYIVLPIVLVILPINFSKFFAIVLASPGIILAASVFITGIFGSEDIEARKGFLSLSQREAFRVFLSGIITVISNYAVIFTALYKINPDRYFALKNLSIDFIDFEYFSFVTITTLGYGDIYPKSWETKLIIISEIIFAILILFISIGLIFRERIENPNETRSS